MKFCGKRLTSLRLATEEEIREKFPDGEIGAAPPLGTLFGLPVYMDVRLTEESYIFFNAGAHRDAIHISVPDYISHREPGDYSVCTSGFLWFLRNLKKVAVSHPTVCTHTFPVEHSRWVTACGMPDKYDSSGYWVGLDCGGLGSDQPVLSVFLREEK